MSAVLTQDADGGFHNREKFRVMEHAHPLEIFYHTADGESEDIPPWHGFSSRYVPLGFLLNVLYLQF